MGFSVSLRNPVLMTSAAAQGQFWDGWCVSVLGFYGVSTAFLYMASSAHQSYSQEVANCIRQEMANCSI